MKKIIRSFGLVFVLLFASNSGALAASNTYKVKRGDTLYRISKTNHITVAEIKQWNHLKSDLIYPNQILIVSKTKTSTPTKTPPVKVITVTATAYTADCIGCSGITATGINLKKHPESKVIAVDPKVIKLGTKVYVDGYGYAVAADKGSSIKGNMIDVFYPTKKAALKWGRKKVHMKILN